MRGAAFFMRRAALLAAAAALLWSLALPALAAPEDDSPAGEDTPAAGELPTGEEAPDGEETPAGREIPDLLTLDMVDPTYTGPLDSRTGLPVPEAKQESADPNLTGIRDTGDYLLQVQGSGLYDTVSFPFTIQGSLTRSLADYTLPGGFTFDSVTLNGEKLTLEFNDSIDFLEEFFKQILPETGGDALEYLNNLINRVNSRRNIDQYTNLTALKPEDYPIFDGLYDCILEEFQCTRSDYLKSNLRVLMNYIAKFSTGGRNSNIWNGPSTLSTAENFIVFNFQSLLANRNNTVANAQMLLVLKYLDNEIIKNREYNMKYGASRKVIVVIDEAHVFIDAKYPLALDFMFQLAKRIRKYNGMQIVITQNIKDFVGSEKLARKSTAIINACQYSFIFSLAPNDMHDLCTLYEKAGGINESEQEQIISAARGQAFVVTGPTGRATVQIETPGPIVELFSNPVYATHYFGGEESEDGLFQDLFGFGPAPEERPEKAAKPEEANTALFDDWFSPAAGEGAKSASAAPPQTGEPEPQELPLVYEVTLEQLMAMTD